MTDFGSMWASQLTTMLLAGPIGSRLLEQPVDGRHADLVRESRGLRPDLRARPVPLSRDALRAARSRHRAGGSDGPSRGWDLFAGIGGVNDAVPVTSEIAAEIETALLAP